MLESRKIEREREGGGGPMAINVAMTTSPSHLFLLHLIFNHEMMIKETSYT